MASNCNSRLNGFTFTSGPLSPHVPTAICVNVHLMLFAVASGPRVCAFDEHGIISSAHKTATTENVLRIDIVCSFGECVYGASVGCANIVRRPSRPDDTSTSFFELTITPSTSGNCSISAIPAFGPMTKTPVDKPS